MAYTADDLRKMRERGTTRASSSDSKRKYTADDLMAMRGKSAQNETTSLYDSYAKQAVSNTPKYRYNSLEQYDTALKESKPKNDFAKRVANAGINALNALSGIGLTGTGATPIKNLPYNKEEMAYNDLKKERNLYAQEHAFDEYKKYQNEADYAKKSQESIEDYLKILDSNNTDQTYSRVYNAMTDEEKAMANYLASNNINMSLQESNRFKDYMMNMRALVDKRSYDEKVANANKEAEDFGGKIGLSAKSVGENLVSSVGTGGEYLASYLGGWTPNPYGGASGLGNLAMAEREAVSKDMGEVGSFVYNTGMSVADSALGAALFGEGYSVLMGTNAFNTSYKDLYERGASRDEILLGALTAGAAETVFEKISLENLLKPRGIKDIQAFAKAWLEQAGVEASEEFFTEMTNIITDELTQGANSEVSQMIYQMRNEGRPEDEIQKAVASILAKRVGEAALGGFLSGGAMGGMFIGNQYAQNRRIGRNTDREELSQALENINPESDVAKEYRGKDLTNLKDTEVGALVMDAYAQADKDARAKYQNAVRDSLENLGLSEGEVKDYYDAIFAEKPTKVQKLLRENETIKDIMRDVNTRILPEIDESARQNKYDIAKTVSNRQGVAKALKKSDLKVGAVTELNGEEVKVTDVIKDGDKITVVTNKGEADPAQLTLSAKDANLVMIASGMENNTMRKAYLNNYHGQNVAEYTDSFSTAYSYGKNGVTEETLLEDIGQTINLSIEDATNIYQQGASEIKKSSNEVVETAEEIKKITKDFRKGNFDDSKIDKKKLSASQRGAYALAQLWTDMGINVSLFNDTSEDSENGYYKDGTVYINLSARYTKQNLKFDRGYVINTMAHELTHWMEDTDSEAFKALKTAIFNYYGEEKTNRLVAQEQQRYEKGTGKSMTKKAAESEVIARACEDMLSDSETLENILLGCNTDQRNTITKKIREFIDKLGEFLNKILHGNMSPSEASRMLRESAEEFERVRKLWAETFTSAVNKVQEDVNMLSDAGIEIEGGIAYNQKTLQESRLAVKNASQIKEVGKILESELGVSEEVALNYVNNLHTIASIEANNIALQYEDTGLSSWVSNSDYGGNFDFSYLCPKRLVYTGTVAEIRKHFNKILNPTRFLAIRRFLIDAGHEAPCTYCYVESRRVHSDSYIQDFLDKNPQYGLTLAQLTNADELEKLRREWIETGKDNGYRAYEKAMNSLSQRSFKALEKRRAYRGEILNHKEFNKSEVERINRNRGLRFFAFSDFEVPHLLDLMQIITDMSVRRLAGFAYTKQANFVEVFGGTGLKINMSCVAKGVDKNGKIIFDDVEGMNSSDAIRLRQKYSKDVGIVCVVFTDEQVKAAMADDRIDYILPFHSSGFSKDMFSMMGLPSNTKDFTVEQTEKWGNETTGNTKNKKEKLKIPVSDFWDDNLSGRENAQRYLDIINANGYTPLFRSALDHVGGKEILTKDGKHKAWDGGKWVLPEGAVGDGYYKLLIEQKMYDNDGNPSPQRPVMPDFNMEAATKITTEFDENPNTFPVAHDVVDKFLEWEKNGEPLFSNKVEVDSLGRELSEGQIAKFKDSKAVDENGDLQVVYHGTIRQFFTFDRGFASAEGNWGKGFYFTNSEDDVEQNYANEEGADLTQKIEREADMLENSDDDEYAGLSHDEIVDELKKKYITSEEPITLECYLDIKNPCYENTWLFSRDIIDISEEDYEDEDAYYEAEGDAWYEKQDEIISKMYDYADSDMYDVIEGYEGQIRQTMTDAYYGDGIRPQELKEKLDRFWMEDFNGNLVSNEIARLMVQALGYDGIIDDTVSKKFKNMGGVYSDTIHYIVFDSNQAKLTDNLNPTENEDIRYSDKIEGSTTEQKISDILQNKYNIGEKEANNEAKGLREIIRRASNNSGRRSGISSVSDKETVALGITTEFVNFGKIDWRGRKLNYDNEKGAYELASYAMLLRNPAYETSRIFYTKGDAIIANDAYTTRLSDATKISDKATNKDAFDDISKKMSRYGADGFYMMHNHPSGSVKPSKLDVETTKLYGNIKGFRGHIVIDHNKYSLIDKSGTYVTADISDGKAIDYNKRVVDHPLLYSKISNADDVGRIAAAITHSPNYSVVLYASSSAEIRMIEAVHDNFVQSKGFEGYIANNKSKIGASWAFLCTENVDVYNKSTLKDLYTRTIFKDVVNYQTFNSYMSDGLNQDPSYAGNGKKLNDTKVYKVSDAESTYYSIKDDGFEEKDSKTLGLTDERIDKLLSGGWYGASAKNYAQAYIAYMSPDDYLKLTTGKDQRDMPNVTDWTRGDSYQAGSGDWDFEKFAKGYDQVPIQLIIDENEGKVIGHEGRHRMARLKEMGYERVPVLLFDRMTDQTKMPHRYMVLTPQVFNKDIDFYGASDRVPVMWMLPFGQDYADKIKQVFGTNSIADVKFNKKVDAEDLLGRNKRLEKENKALEADVQALKDYINVNAELSEGKTWNPVDLNSVAKSLADKSKSDIDLKTLRKQLASTYTYITEQLSSGNESWEDIMDECYAVASDIYDEIKNKPTLSKTRITNEIKKAGVTADEETIAQVQDVVSEASKEDFVRNLAVEVYNGYWKASTLKTSADVMQEKVNKVKSDKTKLKQLNEKQQAKIKQLKFEHRKTMDWMLAEQKKADEIHYGKLIERVREDRDIKLKQLKQYVKDRDARVKDAAERRKLISKIYDVSQTLGKRLLNAEKGRKVPDVLKTPLANLLNAIDFSSQRLLGIKGGKDMFKPTQNDIAMSTLLDKVRMAVDRFNKGEADDDDKNYDFNNLHLPINFAQKLDEIKDELRTVEDAVGERSVYTLQYMTTEELSRLYEAIKAMRTAINNMNEIISTNNAHKVDYLGNEIMEYLDKLGNNKFENAVTNFMTVANKTPFYFFKHLGKGGQELFSFLQNGWDKLADNVEAIRDFTHGKKGEKPLYTADEFEKWKNTVRTYTIYEPTEDGTKERTFSITEAQMMSLYCLSKREQAMSHISKDGVVIDVIKTKRKYGKHDIKMQDTVHLIESELARILADVKNDDRMRTVADKLQEFMSTTCAEWGNEVTQKLYGTDEYTEKNYFPIHVNQDVLASEAKNKSKSIYGMLNQSFTKPLVEDAPNEIYVSDIFDVFATHTGDMAKYNALALPIMDVIKVWNYKEQVDIGDEGNRNVKGVKKSITKAIGKAGNAYIGHLLRDLNGDAESGRYDKATMRLMKNYKTAAVAANIQTALLQPLSYIRAGYMVNGKYLRLALLKKPQVKKCLENIGVQKWKALGFYDTNLNIGLDRIISNGNTWMDNFIEKSLWLTEKMDEITWGYLYTAVELETKDKYPTLSGDKLNEVVAKRLRDVLYGTQVFDSTLSRTDMMRSKSTLVQMETAFGAEPILSVNMLMDAVTSFNQEKKQNGKESAKKKYAKLIGRAGLIYLLSSVVESVLRGVLGKLRKYDDDNKDRFEDIQQDILERTLEELDVLNKIPIVKDAMPYIRKFVLSKIGMGKNIYLDNAQMNEEVFNTIYQALNGVYKIFDGGEMNYKTFEKIFKAVSEATGLPISNILKELKTIYNNTIGDATGNMWK